MRVDSFQDIAEEFTERVNRIVWCTMATVDGQGRPRSRILHPVWEGSKGWIATGRHSTKADHLEHNSYVSVSYWDQQHQQIFAECRTEWEESADEKLRIWEKFRTAPPPMGYDPAAFFSTVDSPDYGLLKLEPWRIELFSVDDLLNGRGPRVWMNQE